MRHMRSGRKLNRSPSHRRALLNNLAMQLLEHERIITTITKAKEMRTVVEPLITRGKVKTLANIRLVERIIKDKTLLKKLFDDIGPSFATRNGGYTRIVKMSVRHGDNALLALIELVGRPKKKPVEITESDEKPSAKAKVKKVKAAVVAEDNKESADEEKTEKAVKKPRAKKVGESDPEGDDKPKKRVGKKSSADKE